MVVKIEEGIDHDIGFPEEACLWQRMYFVLKRGKKFSAIALTLLCRLAETAKQQNATTIEYCECKRRLLILTFVYSGYIMYSALHLCADMQRLQTLTFIPKT